MEKAFHLKVDERENQSGDTRLKMASYNSLFINEQKTANVKHSCFTKSKSYFYK